MVYVKEKYIINRITSDEIPAGLGKMYACDEQFKINIDKYGASTVEFAADAIAAYVK